MSALRHSVRHSIRIARPLRRAYSAYMPNVSFAPNLRRTPREIAQAYIAGKPPFLDPNLFYPQVEITEPSIMARAMDNTFEPYASWLEITRQNRLCPPVCGSFVEFQQAAAVRFGVVVREPSAKFNHRHNSVVVLTLDNELVRLYPQDITFSAFQVLDGAWVRSLEIVQSRFNELYPPRTHLVQLLHQYVQLVESQRERVRTHLERAYASIASPGHAEPTSLLQLASFIGAGDASARSFESYFHQSAHLMSIHLELCRDAERWLVPGCVPADRRTNVAAQQCSNDVPPPALYLANSLANKHSVMAYLSSDNDDRLAALAAQLAQQNKDGVRYDSIVLAMEAWLLPAFDVMKLALVYPHPLLTSKLAEVTGDTSPNAIYKALQDMGVYDNALLIMTDPLLSANVVGEVKLGAASVAKHVEPSLVEEQYRQERALRNFLDSFGHLRTQRTYYHDHVVYLLPELPGDVGFSLEKINSRRYLVNIHVFDVAAHVKPASDTFFQWSNSPSLLQSLRDRLPFSRPISLLVEEFSRGLETFYSVANQAPGKRAERTCMTVTFELNSYENDPMTDLESKVSVSFDRLDHSRVQLLEYDLIERCLTGKLEPSILSSFRLFGGAARKKRETLGEQDHHNVNLVLQVLQRHFRKRNRNFAINANPSSLWTKVEKTSLITDQEKDVVSTEVRLAKEFDGLSRTVFFKRELGIFAGALLAAFASREGIPLFRRTQGLLAAQDSDAVLLKHDNALMPLYSAKSYYDTAFARDSAGYVSLAAFIFANNYLAPSELTTRSISSEKIQNVPLGVEALISAGQERPSMEAYINQLQLLAHAHSKATEKLPYMAAVSKFSHLKKFGYRLHGPMAEATLEAQLEKLRTSHLGADYFTAKSDRFWKIRALEQDASLLSSVTCVVLRLAPESADEFQNDGRIFSTEGRMTCAYCEELAMEVYLLAKPDTDVTIGSVVYGGEVLHLDSLNGVCIFGE